MQRSSPLNHHRSLAVTISFRARYFFNSISGWVEILQSSIYTVIRLISSAAWWLRMTFFQADPDDSFQY